MRGNFTDGVSAGIKKHPISLAEVIGVKTGFRVQITASLTSASAKGIVRTGGTAFWDFPGTIDKADVLSFFINCIKKILIKISKSIFIQHVEITRINTSISLYYILKSTDTSLLAGFRLITGSQRCIIFKGPNKWLTSLL